MGYAAALEGELEILWYDPKDHPAHHGSLLGSQPVAEGGVGAAVELPYPPRVFVDGQTPVASITAEILFADRYESQSSKSPELAFNALLAETSTKKVRFVRVIRG